MNKQDIERETYHVPIPGPAFEALISTNEFEIKTIPMDELDPEPEALLSCFTRKRRTLLLGPTP
jgi:hypothetical protein